MGRKAQAPGLRRIAYSSRLVTSKKEKRIDVAGIYAQKFLSAPQYVVVVVNTMIIA